VSNKLILWRKGSEELKILDIENFISKTGFQKMLKLEEEFSYFKFFNSYKMIAYAGVFIVLVLFIFASQVKQKSR